MNMVMTQPLRLTSHAAKRKEQMNLSTKEIKRTLRDPDLVYPGDTLNHPPGRLCYQKDRLVVIYDTNTNEVVTLLWHRKEGR